MINPSPFLRRALQIDALFSGVSALLLVFGASFLAPLTNLPEGFLRNTGLVLVVFVLGVGYLASRHVMSKGAVVAVIAINAVWTNAEQYARWYLSLDGTRFAQSRNDCMIQLSIMYKTIQISAMIDRQMAAQQTRLLNELYAMYQGK